jgi:hypothetical protein
MMFMINPFEKLVVVCRGFFNVVNFWASCNDLCVGDVFIVFKVFNEIVR